MRLLLLLFHVINQLFYYIVNYIFSYLAGSNLGTIIGLSVGIGIPVLVIVIGGIVLYKKKGRPTYTDDHGIPLTSRNAQANDDVFKNPFLF